MFEKPVGNVVLRYDLSFGQRGIQSRAYLVWQRKGLPVYLSDELKRLQRRALRINYPNLGYAEALQKVSFATLYTRRKELTQ